MTSEVAFWMALVAILLALIAYGVMFFLHRKMLNYTIVKFFFFNQ